MTDGGTYFVLGLLLAAIAIAAATLAPHADRLRQIADMIGGTS
jgi:hypothetical protein